MNHEPAPRRTLYGQYAGFTTRMVAFVLDRLIVIGLLALLVPAWRFVEDSFSLDLFTEVVGLSLVGAVPLVFESLYNIGFWLVAGQTPGKRVMGVRVIRADGQRVGLRNALVRYWAYWISTFLFLGFLWILVDGRRRGWHDKLAGTVVIYSWPEVDLSARPRVDRAWLQRLTGRE
jgi:uncharacterized RDD family membrane protein YckC